MTLPWTDHGKVLVHGPQRRQSAVEHLPPPAGPAARRPRPPSEHRLSAASLDLRPRRPAARRAGLRRDTGLLAAEDAAARSGRGCCSPGRAMRRPTWPTFRSRPTTTTRATCSTRSSSTSARLTGRPSSKSSSSCITSRRCIPACRSGSMPATTSGASASAGATRSSASRTDCSRRSRPTTSATATPSSRTRAARCRSTARCGRSCIRTSCSSGTRTALVVSTLIPRSPDHTTNIVEFYYPEEVQAFERQIVEAHQAAYAESAVEDARDLQPPASRPPRAMAGGRRRRRSVPHAARGRHDPHARLDPARNGASSNAVRKSSPQKGPAQQAGPGLAATDRRG